MKRVAVLLWLVLVLAVSTHWVGRAQQTAGQPVPGSQAADDPRFTGKSVTMESKDLSIARRHFEAGARSAWQSMWVICRRTLTQHSSRLKSTV